MGYDFVCICSVDLAGFGSSGLLPCPDKDWAGAVVWGVTWVVFVCIWTEGSIGFASSVSLPSPDEKWLDFEIFPTSGCVVFSS